MNQYIKYIFTIFLFFRPLDVYADYFSDNTIMHIMQDVYLTKVSDSSFQNILFLPDQQYCEIKVQQSGMSKDKILLTYGYDNLTAREIKSYKPRVISNSYLVKSRKYLRKTQLTTSSTTWDNSDEAKYCRQLELTIFNQKNGAKPKSRMPASTSGVSATLAAASSIKETFYSSCIQPYNALSFDFVTETKFNVNVTCHLLTEDKTIVLNLLKPYFLILDN